MGIILIVVLAFVVYKLVLLQKIFTVSRNRHDCYNCTIIAPGRIQKWLKAYLNGNTSNPILFCSVSDGICNGFCQSIS